MTRSNQWSSIENSIMESTRIDGVERIFLFFGQFGGQTQIRYRKYEECLSSIGVTHAPRYKIEMTLPIGSSIFDKMGIEYHAFRNLENPIQKLKNYYRTQLKSVQSLWWIDDQTTAPPIIRPYRQLEQSVREGFIVESMILVPEIFGKSRVKFDRAAAYLVAKHNAVSSSLRDIFTAGGRIDIKIKNRWINLSRLTYNLYLNGGKIRQFLEEISTDLLCKYWQIETIDNKVKRWETLIAKNNREQMNIVSIYRQSLLLHN